MPAVALELSSVIMMREDNSQLSARAQTRAATTRNIMIVFYDGDGHKHVNM